MISVLVRTWPVFAELVTYDIYVGLIYVRMTVKSQVKQLFLKQGII